MQTRGAASDGSPESKRCSSPRMVHLRGLIVLGVIGPIVRACSAVHAADQQAYCFTDAGVPVTISVAGTYMNGTLTYADPATRFTIPITGALPHGVAAEGDAGGSHVSVIVEGDEFRAHAKRNGVEGFATGKCQ